MSVEFHKNLQILANAGSGKTHTLITRILTLLSMGKDPSKIIALTFTRNAAGEFLTKILLRLAAASASEKEAEMLSKQTGYTKSCGEYLEQLKLLLSQLDKLQLTTLDSFFSRVVGAFPQELGLVDQPKLLDPSAEELTGARTLRKALRKLKLKSPSDFHLVADSFLQMDEGSARRSLTSRLDSFRKEAHGELLEYPEGDYWGNEATIWPTGSPFRKLTEPELENCRKTLLAEQPDPAFTADAAKAWRIMTNLVPGAKGNIITAQIITHLDDWKNGVAQLNFNRKSYSISPLSQKAAAAIVENYLHRSVDYRAREAKAIFRLLEIHEEEYAAEIRGRGVLTFSDITNLLQPSEAFDADRLMIDERLDTQFDHWLLDEFQDTSRSQYRALANLLQEVISSTEDRSFFCVGDIKQAIYGWRGGDARLFKEILGHYNKHGKLIHDEPLTTSWRSSQTVLDALNSTFSTIPSYSGIPEEARKRWAEGWNDHTRSPLAKPLEGYFEWKVVEKGEDSGENVQEEVITLLSGVKEKLDQGMTVALLVRSGEDARRWLDILGAHGIHALSQSNPRVGGDNPLSAAVRSAFSLLAHPGDRFAINHLRMKPLGEVPLWHHEGAFDLGHFLTKGGERLSQGGFSSTMEWLLEALTAVLATDDSFSRERAQALLRIAIKADKTGVTDIDDFIQLLSEYEEPGLSAPNAVQVMTIHKSKGLEYDMVVIPFLGMVSAIDSLKSEVIDRCSTTDPSGNETLLMRLPSQEISKAPGNEMLAKAQEGKKAEKAYEELCNWYVAMSRAKRALYIVSTLPDAENKKDPQSDCPSITLLLKWSLGEGERSTGKADWIEGFQPEVAKQHPEETPIAHTFAPRPLPLEKFLPSDHAERELTGSKAFAERSATALGTAVHELFESIDWLDAATPWKAPATASSNSEAVELMIPCIATPSVQELLTKPKTPTRLWREKRFDMLVEGSSDSEGSIHGQPSPTSHWVSGCFDRVVIHEDAGGRILGADLIDFKTDQCSREELIEKHAPQLLSYRRALASLLGIEESTIRMILVQVRAKDPVVTLP